jgi:hypothetical protein
MEKRIVKFFSEGVRMEGDLFIPDGLKAGERRPGIVLCHDFTVFVQSFSAIMPRFSSRLALWP